MQRGVEYILTFYKSFKMEKKWKEDNLRLTEELAMQDDTITKLKNSLKESRVRATNVYTFYNKNIASACNF